MTIPIEVRVERFWKRVDVRGPDDCWLLRLRTSNKRSYGTVNVGGSKLMTANRFAWLVTHGDPGPLYVLHSCDTPRCVNPRHLFLGTQSENMRDMVSKNRHPGLHLTPELARQIREIFAAGGITKAALARQFNVDWMVVHKVIRGTSWA